MSSPTNSESSSKFSIRKVRKNSIRKFEELNEEYSSSPTTRFLEQKEARHESDMLRALQSLPSAETALQLTPMQTASPRPSNAGEPAEDLPSSVNALQPEQVKELYPSDDDEDFDIYITNTKPRSNSGGTPRDSTAGLNEQQEGKKNDLKFTEYLANPLFDKNAAQEKPEPAMTEEEIIVYNEVVRLMIINGDPQCSNPYLLKRITKTVRNRTKQGVARGYVPSARLRGSSILSLTSETSTEGDLDDEDAEEENKRFNIKTCSKSWKSQLKTLKQANAPSSAPSSPPSSSTEAPAPVAAADVLPLKSTVLYSACSPATGYIPEWKYSLTAKRILDTCRTQGFRI